MSFILDALKKSETDRQRQAAPALFEVKVAAPRRRFPLWAIGVAALLAVNAVVLAWVMLRQPPASVAANNPVAQQPMAAAAAPPGMVTVPATVTIPTTVNIPLSAAPAITLSPDHSQEPGVVAPSNTPPLAQEPALSNGQPAVPPDYNSNDYAPAVSPEQASAVAAQAAALPSRDQAIAQGAQLPDLRLDLHVYADNPAERFVFINMRKLREGESLPEGVRVEQITPTGAKLSFHGRQFTLDGNN